MEEQALGVVLLRQVRCVSCGKVFHGKLEQEYERGIDMINKEIKSFTANIRDMRERESIALDIRTKRTKELYNTIGIKRDCCKINISHMSQYTVGAPSPPGNIIKDRQSEINKMAGYKRSVTIIHLSKGSRVPGMGSMMSMPGEDDYSPEWKDYLEKARKDLAPPIEYTKEPTKLIKSKPASVPSFNIKSMTKVVSGETTAIKPEYLDMLEDVEYTRSTPNGQVDIITSFSNLTLESQPGDDLDVDDVMDYEYSTLENLHGTINTF